ncbi:MAG: TetR/AcrR family transcriptional regulator [Actinomycetes bacterium]
MPSNRHKDVLTAARDVVLAVGVRRTTLAEVARRAGVSRMTVYRAFPDVASLVSALMTEEFGSFIADVSEQTADSPTSRDRLVAAVVQAAREIPNNPVFRRVADVDPELLLPYVVERLGTTQRAAVDLLRNWVVEGQRDGSIRTGDPKLLAHSLLLTTQSFVLGARVTGAPPRGKALAELRELVDRYLRSEAA